MRPTRTAESRGGSVRFSDETLARSWARRRAVTSRKRSGDRGDVGAGAWTVRGRRNLCSGLSAVGEGWGISSEDRQGTATAGVMGWRGATEPASSPGEEIPQCADSLAEIGADDRVYAV